MNHRQFTILLAVAVFVNFGGFELALAQQPIYPKRLSSRLIKDARFSELPQPLVALVDSAIKHYDDGDNEGRQRSVQDLRKILTMEEVKKTSSLFRAWVHEWLALSYFALDSSMMLVEQHVKQSLDENMEIWREYPDLKRLPEEVRDIYQTRWAYIESEFRKKLRSIRIAAGPISRVDFSYRMLENWDIVGGIGTPIKVEVVPDRDVTKSNFSAFKQLLLFMRIQWMRKTIERLSAGVYLGFSFEDSSKSGIQFSTMYVNGGPILSYTYKSGWEIGSTFEVARLVIKGAPETDLSQTALKRDPVTLSHGIFEFYLRKWF